MAATIHRGAQAEPFRLPIPTLGHDLPHGKSQDRMEFESSTAKGDQSW